MSFAEGPGLNERLLALRHPHELAVEQTSHFGPEVPGLSPYLLNRFAFGHSLVIKRENLLELRAW